MMDANKLKEILDKHLHWIREDCDGWENMRADLSGTDLSGTDLSDADLSDANLYGANLSGTDLSGTDLSGTDLSDADLSDANLYGANLSGAYLYRAYLYRADLSDANLYGANLSGAYLYRAKIGLELVNRFFPICCPEYGAFVAWKKAGAYIVKLQIPEDAKRSSAFGRKCRASKAVCLAVENVDGTDSGMTEISSDHDHSFIYRVGETVEVADFDDDRTHECAPGIHFFVTRQEAVNY